MEKCCCSNELMGMEWAIHGLGKYLVGCNRKTRLMGRVGFEQMGMVVVSSERTRTSPLPSS